MRFCKIEISIVKRKAVYVFLFLYYTKCVEPDDLLKRSKHVTPLNAYILSYVNRPYIAINLKHSGMPSLKLLAGN